MVSDTLDWSGSTVVGPALLPATLSYQLAANTGQTVIANVPGQSIILFAVTLQNYDNSNVFINLQTGTALMLFSYVAQRQGFATIPFGGLKLPQNVSLVVFNPSGIPMAFPDHITVVYAVG